MIDLNDPVVQEIVKARVRMLFEKPFFGNLAARLVIVDASKWCKTAATDGRHLFYNREFIKGLSKNELLFLVAHEVMHCVYDHLGRRGNRDPKIWNMANDYIVNYTLKSENVGSMPSMGLYDPKYTDDMTSEEVYDDLIKNSTTIKATLDEHLELNPGGDGEGDSGGEGRTAEVTIIGRDGPPVLTEEDIENIRNEMRAAVIQTAQSVDAGQVPAGIRRLISDLTQPKMDWRALLDAHIRSSIKDDYSFTRISNRSWGTGLVLPSQNFLDTVDVAVTIDTSGSMTIEMLRDILSETAGIMQTFRDFKLKLWTFDTKTYGYKEFTPANIDEIHEYQPQGGGGTMFECNWEFMKREGIEPTRLVMFTDGYPNSTWGDENYCDTLFVIHGSKTIEAPFGMTAYYEAND